MALQQGDPERWEVREEKGSPGGGLYELEIPTRFYVIDRRSGETVHTFFGLYEASYDGAGWSGDSYSGVVRVEISADGLYAIGHLSGGGEERVALPLD